MIVETSASTESRELSSVQEREARAGRLSKVRAQKGATLMVVLTLVASAINYGSNVIFSHVLGPAGYGELTALFALSIVLAVPTGAAQTMIAERVAVFTSSGEMHRVRYLVRHAFAHVSVIAVVVGLVYLAATPLCCRPAWPASHRRSDRAHAGARARVSPATRARRAARYGAVHHVRADVACDRSVEDPVRSAVGRGGARRRGRAGRSGGRHAVGVPRRCVADAWPCDGSRHRRRDHWTEAQAGRADAGRWRRVHGIRGTQQSRPRARQGVPEPARRRRVRGAEHDRQGDHLPAGGDRRC